MESVYKGRYNKKRFSSGGRETKDKYKYYPSLHSDGGRPRKKQGLSHRFKILELANCPFENGDEDINNLLYRCSILHKKEKYLNVVF